MMKSQSQTVDAADPLALLRSLGGAAPTSLTVRAALRRALARPSAAAADAAFLACAAAALTVAAIYVSDGLFALTVPAALAAFGLPSCSAVLGRVLPARLADDLYVASAVVLTGLGSWQLGQVPLLYSVCGFFAPAALLLAGARRLR